MTSAASYRERWNTMWHQLGAICPDLALLDDLILRYGEPHRKYHTMQHLDECLVGLDTVRDVAIHAAEIELALWFHDGVYEVRNHDNELKSADWARAILLGTGASAIAADRVHALVMATCHNALPATPDEKILVDIDLSILGADELRFAQYETQVRAEYSWVPEAVYRSKRATILQAFLDRKSIYSTAYFQSCFEANARRNLSLSVARLSGL
jgi:predicted metal-dependent HD superfamily phosphohydrolase